MVSTELELKYLEEKIIIEVPPPLPVLSAGLEGGRLLPIRETLQSVNTNNNHYEFYIVPETNSTPLYVCMFPFCFLKSLNPLILLSLCLLKCEE